MADKAWKAFERRLAVDWGTVRNALSGRNSKVTASDTHHPRLFLEAKLNANSGFWTLYSKSKELADKEGKTVLLCLGKKFAKGYITACHVDDLPIMVEEYLKSLGLHNTAKSVARKVKSRLTRKRK